MNVPVSDSNFTFSSPLSAGSAELGLLFEHIAANSAQWDHDRTLPWNAIDLIRRSRFGAFRLSVEDRGSGGSIRELLQEVIRLGEADANVAHILRNHFSVIERLVRRPASDQARVWQRAVADGGIVGLATTELGTSQIGNVKLDTTLTPDGNGYRLNGVKYYSTGSLYADYVLVRAADPAGANAALLIPTKREGIELVDDWDGMGQRLTGTGTTYFRNVRVESSEAVFDTPDVGYGIPYSNTFAQLYLTAVNAGIIHAILRDATTLVRTRGRNFYYAPAEHTREDPLLQQTIGQISSYAFAARTAVLAAADALDQDSDAADRNARSPEIAAQAALLSAQAKIVTDELAIRSGSLIFDVGGASATKRTLNLDRHWRNARTLASHNPSAHKARAIGDLQINGAPLPSRGFF